MNLKLNKLYEYLKKETPVDLRQSQYNMLGPVSRMEENNESPMEIGCSNLEYGYIMAKYPGCKVIEIDFENASSDPMIPDYDDAIIDSDIRDILIETYKLSQFLMNKEGSLDADPTMFRYPEGKQGPTPIMGLIDYNGIIFCDDHDGFSGGCSWGYAIVNPDGSLVWDGEIPYEEESND